MFVEKSSRAKKRPRVLHLYPQSFKIKSPQSEFRQLILRTVLVQRCRLRIDRLRCRTRRLNIIRGGRRKGR